MKWLLALALLGGTTAAEKIVIMEPVIAMACPKAPAWPAVLECFQKHGLTAKVVATLDDSKLVAVTTNDTTHELQGFALYVHAAAKRDPEAWRLGGLLQEDGNVSDFEVVRIEHVPKHGYRFDIAASQPSSATFNDVTSVPSIYRQIITSFCSGESYRCMQLIPKCEQIVLGQSISVFDGTITIHDNIASLKGVGSVPACSASVDLGL